MRRKFTGVGAIAAGLTILLAGCSGGDTGGQATVPSSAPPAKPSPSAAPSSKPGQPSARGVAWMDGLCGELVNLAGLSNIKKPDVKPGDVAGAQQALSDVLGKFEGALTSLVSGLQGLPPAPDPAGDQVKQDLLDTFVPIKDKAAAIKDNLDAAEPGDKQALGEAVKGLQSIGQSLKQMKNPLRQLKGTELLAAGQQAKSCQQLGGFSHK